MGAAVDNFEIRGTTLEHCHSQERESLHDCI
jgi:hypothetical protein